MKKLRLGQSQQKCPESGRIINRELGSAGSWRPGLWWSQHSAASPLSLGTLPAGRKSSTFWACSPCLPPLDISESAASQGQLLQGQLSCSHLSCKSCLSGSEAQRPWHYTVMLQSYCRAGSLSFPQEEGCRGGKGSGRAPGNDLGPCHGGPLEQRPSRGKALENQWKLGDSIMCDTIKNKCLPVPGVYVAHIKQIQFLSIGLSFNTYNTEVNRYM